MNTSNALAFLWMGLCSLSCGLAAVASVTGWWPLFLPAVTCVVIGAQAAARGLGAPLFEPSKEV